VNITEAKQKSAEADRALAAFTTVARKAEAALEEAMTRARSSRKKEDLAAAAQGRVALDLAMEDVATATNARDQAHAEVARLERAAARAELADQEAELSTWLSSLDGAAERIVILERELAGAFDVVARRAMEAEAAHDEAMQRAAKLGIVFEAAAPSVEIAFDHVRSILTKEREAEDRPSLADLLSPPVGYSQGWKTAGASLADREANARTAARLRQEEAMGRALQQGADIASAAHITEAQRVAAAALKRETIREAVIAGISAEPQPAAQE
jgi:hypothetical protein